MLNRLFLWVDECQGFYQGKSTIKTWMSYQGNNDCDNSMIGKVYSFVSSCLN